MKVSSKVSERCQRGEEETHPTVDLSCDRELFTVTHFKGDRERVKAMEGASRKFTRVGAIQNFTTHLKQVNARLPLVAFRPLLYPINSPKVDNIYAELNIKNGEKTRITSKCES